jgi:hypothetical protein
LATQLRREITRFVADAYAPESNPHFLSSDYQQGSRLFTTSVHFAKRSCAREQEATAITVIPLRIFDACER